MTLREAFERHGPPGAVGLIAREGDVEVVAFGAAERDSLFRIASITKPITAAAVMLLVDEGRIALDDPIERLVPELASPVVVRTPESPVHDVVKVVRPILVADVLDSRAGWGFPSDFSLPAVQLVFQEVFTWGRSEPFASSQEWIDGLARVPLLYQPGEAWLYNVCSDLQGVLIERASGLELDNFLAERIFEPLGMRDTAFHVPAAKRSRLVPAYAADGEPLPDDVPSWPPGFASGAGGLVSTADDWLRFGRMLLAGGGGLLSRESLDRMTTNHLTEAQRSAAHLFLEGEGWGFGGSVRADGRYGWVGGSGTSAHVLPATGTVAILLTQVQMAGPTPAPLMRDFWAVADAGTDTA
jgi:CubicO group peptidase (beta-lactamase class C family)